MEKETYLEKICNLDFVHQLLEDNKNNGIDHLIELLVLKALEEAKNVSSLKSLEGESSAKGNLRILKTCPMASTLNAIKKENLAKTGKKKFPKIFQDIVQKYLEKYPNEGAILHPLCIVHQAIRDIIASKKNFISRGIACRGAACHSPKKENIAYSKEGIHLSGKTKKQVTTLIKGHSCVYLLKKF